MRSLALWTPSCRLRLLQITAALPKFGGINYPAGAQLKRYDAYYPAQSDGVTFRPSQPRFGPTVRLHLPFKHPLR